MRRDEVKVGERYLGPGGKCYQIIDGEPGWRIGFDGEWVKDDSVRFRTTKGKKVAFRSNHALKSLIIDGDEEKPAVITPNRLVCRWDRRIEEEIRQADLTDLECPPYEVLEDGRIALTLEDLESILAIARSR